jgi:hypothetical protein
MLAPLLTHLADASNAASVMRDFISPVMESLCVAASLVCAFFLTTGGYHYITSSGNVEGLSHAKRTLKNALIGLILVLGAAVLTTILTHAYAGSQHAIDTNLPALTPVKPQPVSNGLVDILIKAITGLLNNIIQSVAEPFLKALSYFTTSTPLMADNSAVFNLWLVMVGITDVAFTLIVALLGFHVMGAGTFGFDEIEFKHLLPRLGLVFMLVNCSIFAIDGVIELSNAMIHAVNAAAGTSGSVWDVLTDVVKQAGGQGVAALLIMVAFLIFAVILLVYYVGRLVTLFIGAVLSPLLCVLWLIPGFRDFSETAAKVYVTTVFVLFVHVVILQLAASLFAGMVVGSPDHTPDTLMAMVVGLATLIALLKTQGVMTQLSYASLGPRTARKLGGQFINGVSALSGGARAVRSGAHSTTQSHVGRSGSTSVLTASPKKYAGQASSNAAASRNPTANQQGQAKTSKQRAPTGDTSVAPNLATARPKGNLNEKIKADKKAMKEES